jgi:hypothetical protein
MIIRATKKLLNTSGIRPVKNLNDQTIKMPGEWYASTISLHRPGKLAIHFLHCPTFISIIVPGKSLNKVIRSLTIRTSALLRRLGYSSLEPLYQLDSKLEVFATNSKSILAYINQIKSNLEVHFAQASSIESINYDQLEDIHNDWIFFDKLNPKGYFMPKDRLANLLKDFKNSVS